MYFEAVDLLIQAIETRFNQPGYKVYYSLEALFVKVFKKGDYSEEVKSILEVCEADFIASNLHDYSTQHSLFHYT